LEARREKREARNGKRHARVAQPAWANERRYCAELASLSARACSRSLSIDSNRPVAWS